MEQKENKVNPPKKRLSQSSSSLFAKPRDYMKPAPATDIFKKSTATSQASGKPACATPVLAVKVENGFKTPLKPVQSLTKTTQSTVDLGNLKAAIQEEMAAMNVEKPLLDSKSQTVVKPTVSRNLLFNKINTPKSDKKAPTNFTNTFKFDPKCVTGIPWIQPKKTTIPKPFTFASAQLAAKRAVPK